MTKKDFKEHCDFNHVYGRGKQRINAIYCEWKSNEYGRGFKYAVATSIENCTKAELFEHLYQWVVNGVYLPYYVYSRFAQYDKQRFKVPLSFNPQTWN
jgi:hypothetical protein